MAHLLFSCSFKLWYQAEGVTCVEVGV
jgi:hypothetical protein